MNGTTKKISAFLWAFLVLLLAFFATGVATLGSLRATGKSFVCEQNQAVQYDLELVNGDKLDSVYVNAGLIRGEKASLTVKSTNKDSTVITENWSSLGTVEITNETSFAWVAVCEGANKNGVKRVSISSSAPLSINEIVCLGVSGEKMLLSVSTKNQAELLDEYEAGVDAQGAFTGKVGAYHAFTASEKQILANIALLKEGRLVYEDGAYAWRGEFNYLTTLAYYPFVAVLGESVFALRLPTLLAVCTALFLAWLIIKEITKSEKTALFTSVALALCFGALARFGVGYALVLCAVTASAYFAVRFFSRGISSARVLRGGCTVFLSGLFSAVALALDSVAVFPIIGILVLLGAGMRRQAIAYRISKEKLGGAEKEEKERARVLARAYAYKNRVCYCFIALSFVACTFLLLIVSTAISYTAVIKAYGVETNFGKAVWLGIRQAFIGTGSEGNGALLCLLPWQKSEWRFNEAFALVCPLAFLGATAKVVYGFIKNESDKTTLRVRRGYFLLLGGLLGGLLFALFKTQAFGASVFALAYLGFLPLLALAMEETESKRVRVGSRILWTAVLVGAVVAFAFGVPVVYGI